MMNTAFHIAVYLVALVTDAVLGCRYPEVMYGTQQDWRIMSPDPAITHPHAFRAVVFEGSTMRIDFYRTKEYMDGISYMYRYECLQQYQDYIYTVRRIQEDRETVFQCIQFIIRDQNLVQWRLSPIHETNPVSLCHHDTLVLQDETLVYYHLNGFWNEDRNAVSPNHRAHPQACPLVGGYLVDWLDSSSQDRKCRDAVPPMKLEAECEPGEGFRFVLPYEQELPGCSYPSVSQGPLDMQYSCLASWEDGIYTFMVLVHREDDFYIPCVRFPTSVDQIMELLFFKDGRCVPHTDVASHSDSYMQMSLSQYLVTDECMDLSPACLGQVRCDSVEIQQIAACRDTCQLCSHGSFNRKDFADTFQGVWTKVTAESESWVIDGPQLVIDGSYTYDNLGVSACTNDSSDRVTPGLGSNAIEYNMISLYDNGCSPRATTLSLVAHSDSVISYRQSRSALAPIDVDYHSRTPVLDQYTGSWCESTSYSYDPPPVLGTYHKTTAGWHTLIKEGGRSGPCSMPFSSEDTELTMKLNLGFSGACTVKLIKAYDALSMEVTNCRFHHDNDVTAEWEAVQTLYQEYECLASFSDQISQKHFIITRSANPISYLSSRYVCWIVKSEEISWHLPGDCDSQSLTWWSYSGQGDAEIADRPITFHLVSSASSPATHAAFLIVYMLLYPFNIVP